MVHELKVKMAFGALGMLVLGTLIANRSYMIQSEPIHGSRTLASVGAPQVVSENSKRQNVAAAHLASSKRHVASLGHAPDPLENLRFGVLEGKYALNIEHGKINDISFIDNPNTESRPEMIRDRIQFLKNYSELFGLQGVPRRISIRAEGMRVVEEYQVSDRHVVMVLDDQERLMEIKAVEVK